ncbi:ABC transporter permease [Leadbettera azotonutricia]|uniref:Glutathione transport system permease protein GsiD n=1 Tax=Leadbettera azotonutricia (strain ATCC BAA-888 / DSM 13862 / ZAS-9) TaxID=545695 RepID=F5Y8C1_LEAAZ|nr:ABC transporter permease [Leadbettera azotonutricia]AEF81307.1 glutathione transport system permease protein GsiD [Leadbettera azotonutricia ZAS-9]
MKTAENMNFMIGAALAFLIGAMILASLFYLPYGYNDMDSRNRFSPPGSAHLMGTDNFGRDIFSRVMAGGKYTLLVALVTVAGSAAAGSAIGMVSGFAGGFWDELVMRLMDTLSSFPGILLTLVMVAILGNSHATLIIALLVLFVPSFTRVMRSGTLQYKSRDFVLSARIQGTSRRRIIFVHILPNLLPSLLSASVLGLSNAILAESTMSYLGLGIQPPVPSWGRMLAESQNYLFNAPWCALAPGIMIMLTVLAFHFLGEGLRQRNS